MKLEDLFEAAFTKKKVIRHGKVVKKKQCPKGYKFDGKRCVKISAVERLARKKGAIKANRSGKAMRKRSLKRSLRIRKRKGL